LNYYEGGDYVIVGVCLSVITIKHKVPKRWSSAAANVKNRLNFAVDPIQKSV